MKKSLYAFEALPSAGRLVNSPALLQNSMSAAPLYALVVTRPFPVQALVQEVLALPLALEERMALVLVATVGLPHLQARVPSWYACDPLSRLDDGLAAKD